ncbi:MAG: hypothetical protein QXP98_08800 [Thermoproteus sp.]
MGAYRYVAPALIAALSLFLPLPLAELGLSLSLFLTARSLGGTRGIALTAAAVYLSVRGLLNFFVAGAIWAVEPLPLAAAGYYLARVADEREDARLFAVSRALYFGAALAALTAPFLPQPLKGLWVPALLMAAGSALRRLKGDVRLVGSAMMAVGILSALSFLVEPASREISNDILYISLISVPAITIAARRRGGDEYIPTLSNIWTASEDSRLKEAAEAYIKKGDVAAIAAVLSYAYALAGIPLERALAEISALKNARGREGRRRALEAALARLHEP